MNDRKKLFKIIIMLILYCILSSVILISDKKEPRHLSYDVAFPKSDEDEPDKTDEEIQNSITAFVSTDEIYTQVIYTPKIITGIDTWMRTSDSSSDSDTYNLLFYNADGTLAHSQMFSAKDIAVSGYTTIIFDDFALSEGRQYNLVIEPTSDTTAGLYLGIIPDYSTWAGGLYSITGLMEGTGICFNLVYDYQNWGFINWMVLTILCFLLLIRYGKDTPVAQYMACGVLLILIVIFVLVYADFVVYI